MADSLASQFQGAAQATWKPPKLVDGKFATKEDAETWRAHLYNSGYSSAGTGAHGEQLAAINAQQVANNEAAKKFGEANGFWKPPPGEGGGFFGGMAKFIGDSALDIITMPPVAAALTAGTVSALAPAAGGAGAEASSIPMGLEPEVGGIAAGDAGAAASTIDALPTAASGAVAGVGTSTQVPGTQFGGTVQSGAAPSAGASGGGSTGSYLSTAKGVMDLALAGAGLLTAAGVVGPGASQAPPPEPTAPPADQTSAVDQQGVAAADNANQRFPNGQGSGDDTLFNGASGIDPFMLNLGRAKLLGQ